MVHIAHTQKIPQKNKMVHKPKAQRFLSHQGYTRAFACMLAGGNRHACGDLGQHSLWPHHFHATGSSTLIFVYDNMIQGRGQQRKSTCGCLIQPHTHKGDGKIVGRTKNLMHTNCLCSAGHASLCPACHRIVKPRFNKNFSF
jgi:hypothetical protein